MQQIIHGNCYEVLPRIISSLNNPIIVTDPPFNIGYKYKSYNDNLNDDVYFKQLAELFSLTPAVIVHYPESLYRLALEMNEVPTRVISWVYNSNTPRQHRDIAFFKVSPDFTKVKQPYKNPKDKRIKERIAAGKIGAKLYDWWNINQIKNVNKEKTEHPCQMPLEVMKNIVGILPDNVTIIDPFAGSGTTGKACLEIGVDFVGIEIDEEYCQIALNRLKGGDNNSVLRL